METCIAITGILLVAAVIVVVVFAARASSRPSSEKSPRRHGRFDSCPSCETQLFAADRHCPDCGLELSGKLASKLDRIRIARREIRALKDDGLLDEETALRVAEQLAQRKFDLLHPKKRAEQPHLPPPLPLNAQRTPAEPIPAREHTPPEPVSVAEIPRAEPSAPKPPRRSLAEVFGQYMHERNILWGELAGGLLIVGCSIALVLSLWRTLETLPYFTFLLASGITGAVFGAGYYTLHHWKLKSTSRGLLAIALLLTPLNLLLLADLGNRGNADAIDIAVKVTATIAFAGLARTGGRDLVGLDSLPGVIPRGWLLALAVVGAPASQMAPAVWQLPVWLPFACYGLASGITVRRLSRDQKRPDAPPLNEQSAIAILVFAGLGLFALFAAWGFLLSRADELPPALQRLAVPTVLAAMPALAAGLLVQRRLIDPAGLRATGTGASLVAIMILAAGLVLAWPNPLTLLLTATAIAMVLGWIAYRDELPWMYAGAIPCAALASVLIFAGATPPDVSPSQWLAERIARAESGAVLAAFAWGLLAVSQVFWRLKRQLDALAVGLGAAGVSVVALLFVTIHGIDQPQWALATHLACAAGFIAASFRWRLRIIAQVGVWLLVPATLWGLWATVPHERDVWGIVLAAESLLFAFVAVGLRPFALLRIACRDVAGATAILAPVLALFSANFPHEWTHSGTLFLIATTALVLAGLYRLPALTGIGSFVALVGFAHLAAFTLALEPWRLAVLLALLIHTTLTTTAVVLSRRAERRKPPDDHDSIGRLTPLRSPLLFVNPFRLSAPLPRVSPGCFY